MQGDDSFEFVGKMRAPFGFALRESLLGAIIGRLADDRRRRGVTPNTLRLATMPPTAVPPKPTPW